MPSHNYRSVIGLEIHAQLLTKTKMFSPEPTSYGEPPNTQLSPLTIAHPGALPSLNKTAIDYALKMALACHTTITKNSHFARKNYFYPDLPKGFQITQDKTPICTNGYLSIQTNKTKGKSLEKNEKLSQRKKIRIQRIHLEEDTGKSLHNLIPGKTLLDFNRAGTPLIEIVTEPDLSTPEEAYQFLTEIRQLVRYLEICDGNMEEGSLRCDANISVMTTDQTEFGTRVEIKNLNSISNVQRALQYEIQRHITLLEEGKKLTEETRSYNPTKGETIHQRKKESLSEYRYFPEPNLSPIVIDKAWIERIQDAMPPLPKELFQKFTTQYKLSTYDAEVLTSQKDLALFFESICNHLPTQPKAITNWVLGPIKSYLNEHKITLAQFPLQPSTLALLIEMVTNGKVTLSIATKKIFPALIKEPTQDLHTLAKKLSPTQLIPSQLNEWIDQTLTAYPNKITQYQEGKKGLLGFFVGQVIRQSKQQADPAKVAEILLKKLNDS